MLNRRGPLVTFVVTCDHCSGAVKVPGLTCAAVRDQLLLSGWWFLASGAYCPSCVRFAPHQDLAAVPDPGLAALTVIETVEHRITVTVDELDAVVPRWRAEPALLAQEDAQDALAGLYIEDIGDPTAYAVTERAVTTIETSDGCTALST